MLNKKYAIIDGQIYPVSVFKDKKTFVLYQESKSPAIYRYRAMESGQQNIVRFQCQEQVNFSDITTDYLNAKGLPQKNLETEQLLFDEQKGLFVLQNPEDSHDFKFFIKNDESYYEVKPLDATKKGEELELKFVDDDSI